MSKLHRPTREPLLRLIQDLLEAGAEAGVLHPLDCEPAPAVFEQTAPIVVEVLRDACNRARVDPSDPAPLDAAEEFLLRALRFDERAALEATYRSEP